MDRRRFLSVVARGVPALAIVGVARARQRRIAFTRAQMAEFLVRARVLESSVLSTGITGSRLAIMRDGTLTHRAHIQHVDERHAVYQGSRGAYLNFRDSYVHNLAASHLDELLGLGMVPVAVEREIDQRAAAVSWWVDDVLMTERERFEQEVRPPDPDLWARQLFCIRVFDALIHNIDRNAGNIVITRDWSLWMIDHTRSFRPEPRLLNPEGLIRCDRWLLSGLEGLTADRLREAVGRQIGDQGIDGLLERRDAIVALIAEKRAANGDDVTLFDYLPRPDAVEAVFDDLPGGA